MDETILYALYLFVVIACWGRAFHAWTKGKRPETEESLKIQIWVAVMVAIAISVWFGYKEWLPLWIVLAWPCILFLPSAWYYYYKINWYEDIIIKEGNKWIVHHGQKAIKPGTNFVYFNNTKLKLELFRHSPNNPNGQYDCEQINSYLIIVEFARRSVIDIYENLDAWNSSRINLISAPAQTVDFVDEYEDELRETLRIIFKENNFAQKFRDEYDWQTLSDFTMILAANYKGFFQMPVEINVSIKARPVKKYPRMDVNSVGRLMSHDYRPYLDDE